MEKPNENLKPCVSLPDVKILIVDDLPTNIRVVKELLNPCGAKVYISLSGKKAVEMIQNEKYDLVFMDHLMPEMDGMETITRIRALYHDRQDDYYLKLPIVLLTANTIDETEDELLKRGINGYLAKPADPIKLYTEIERLLPAEKVIRQPGNPEASSLQQDVQVPFSIPGLDTEIGLRYTGGSIPSYIDILAEFCRDTENNIEKTTMALHTNDYKLLETLMHNIKGSARSIGATAIGDNAAGLEAVFAAVKTTDRLESDKCLTDSLIEKLLTLTGNIRKATKPTAAGREQLSVAALNLDLLKTALASLDIETVNQMLQRYTALSLDNETREKVSEIDDLVLKSEYKKAIELIDNILLQ